MRLGLVLCLGLVAACDGSPAAGSPSPAPPGFRLVLAIGTPVGAPAASRDYVYVPEIDAGKLLKVDRNGHRVAEIPIGEPRRLVEAGCAPFSVHQMPVGSLRGRYCEVPTAVATRGSLVWVPKNDTQEVLCIDGNTDRVLARIPVGILPFDIAAGRTGVWVTDYEHSKVVHIDAATRHVVATIHVDRAANIAVADNATWVVDHIDGSVERIDPATNRVVATISVGVDPLGIAASASAVWVKNETSNTVSRIDPATNRLVDTIRVGDRLCCDGIDRLAIEGARVWVGGVTLQAIDGSTDRIVRAVGHDAVAATAQGATLWFTDSAAELLRVN